MRLSASAAPVAASTFVRRLGSTQVSGTGATPWGSTVTFTASLRAISAAICALSASLCALGASICTLSATISVSYAKIFVSSVALICSSALACWPDGAFWSYFAAMAATTESIVSSSVPVRTPLNSPALMLTTGGEELSGARLTRICPAKPSTCKASPNGVTDSVPRRARRLRSSSSSGSSARRLASVRLAVMSAPCFAC